MSRNQTVSANALRVAEVLADPNQLKSRIKDALPLPAKRSAMRIAGSAREAYWRTFHPLTFGAAVALTDVEVTEVALVRQSYCDSDLWQLPGGGIDRANMKAAKTRLLEGVHADRLPKEFFLPGAIRELQEELGVKVDEESVSYLGSYPNFSWRYAKVPANRDTLGIFHAPVEDFNEIEFDIQRSELDAAKRWNLGNILDRTIGSPKPDPNMAWYLGNVATVLSITQPELNQ